MDYIGDFAEDATVNIYFTTNDSSGAAVAPSSAFEAADTVIYKDNSATQKATTNGITMTSPFDTVTGLHLVTIDTSVDTGDAGFWAVGSDYTVVLSPDETVDSQIIVHVLGQFSIENRTTYPKADVPTNFADLSITASTGRVDVAAIAGTVQTANDVGQDVNDILTDTNELQGDWTDGGRLDLIIDAIVADTNELQTDDVPGLIAALNDLSAAAVNAEVVDVLRTDTLPDSVAADGSASTIAQAIYMILQFLTEKEAVGTTLTVKKVDGSTSLATFTLDHPTSPTSITRAT